MVANKSETLLPLTGDAPEKLLKDPLTSFDPTVFSLSSFWLWRSNKMRHVGFCAIQSLINQFFKTLSDSVALLCAHQYWSRGSRILTAR